MDNTTTMTITLTITQAQYAFLIEHVRDTIKDAYDDPELESLAHGILAQIEK